MSNDDFVQRLARERQEAQRADEEQRRVAQRGQQEKLHALLEYVRRELPTLQERAKDRLHLIRYTHRQQVGTLRKKWVTETDTWAGWLFHTQPGHWGMSHGGADCVWNLYLLHDGRVLKTAEHATFQTQRRLSGADIQADYSAELVSHPEFGPQAIPYLVDLSIAAGLSLPDWVRSSWTPLVERVETSGLWAAISYLQRGGSPTG